VWQEYERPWLLQECAGPLKKIREKPFNSANIRGSFLVVLRSD
jgi:hypothetical protein